MSVQTVSGPVLLEKVQTDSLNIHSVSGALSMSEIECPAYQLTTVSADAQCMCVSPFQKMVFNSVSGSFRVVAPIDTVNAHFKSPGGRILTTNVSIQEEGTDLFMTSVAGNLEIEGSLPKTSASGADEE